MHEVENWLLVIEKTSIANTQLLIARNQFPVTNY